MALARWQSTIVDLAGSVLPAAQITVRREVAGAPLAVLYSDRDGVTPLGNPFQADSEGFAAFHTAGGPLRIDVALGEFSRTLRYVAIGTLAEQDSDAVSIGTLTQTSYQDMGVISDPPSPLGNVLRRFARVVGGRQQVSFKDSSGNVFDVLQLGNVKNYGAKGDGSANDTSAVVAAIGVMPANGGEVFFPAGVYMVDPDELVLGDGDNSAISTVNGIALIGESSAPYLPSAGVTIKAKSSGANLLDIRGPIFGLRIENIVFDCDGVCQVGINAFSVNNGVFKNFGILNFTAYGLFGDCRTGPSGSVAWAAGNIIQNFQILSADVADFGAGIFLDGSFADDLDWHRNVFQGGVVQVNKGATNPTYCIQLLFTDSNTWIEVDCATSGSGGGGGFGLQFNGTSNANYPQNNFFYGCSIEDGINVAGTIGKNYFVAFATRDGEAVPNDPNLIGFTDQGEFFGQHTFRGKFGYSTGVGVGGTVTQLTSKSTGVTLDKLSGDITMHNATLNANTAVTFTLTNSFIESGDNILFTTYGGTVGAYLIYGRCNNGSAFIDVKNITAGNLSEALSIRYTVIKSATT